MCIRDRGMAEGAKGEKEQHVHGLSCMKKTHSHQEMDSDDDGEPAEPYTKHRYLDVAAVKAVCDAFKKNKRGYLGILNFTLFCALYFAVIYGQRNNATVGLENRALRTPTQLLKPRVKVSTVPEFWQFLENQIVPWLVADESWETEVVPNAVNQFNHSELLRGTNAQQYSQIIGGIALVQTRAATVGCPAGTILWPSAPAIKCYSEDRTNRPFAVTGVVPQGLGGGSAVATMQVPYDIASEAYYALLPSSATPDQLTGLVRFLREARFVDAATRSIEVRVPVFNPNTNIIGTLTFAVEIDLGGHLSTDLTAAAIPYYLYNRENWRFQAMAQILLLYWVCFMVRGLWSGYLSTWALPAWLDKRYPDAKRNSSYVSVMPVNPAGQTLVAVPATLFLTVGGGVGCWVMLILGYINLHAQTQYQPEEAIKLFGAQPNSLIDIITSNRENVHRVHQILALIQSLHWRLDLYFYTAAMTVIFMIFRMFHYLDFQGKLNAITVTVRTGVGELFLSLIHI
eukprot:TRINITY_DN61023_c0_g1_i1.p1 TRINITY_DN61023_c0_g1~~TRINITY_DN61023_c0_g1_i1.p1  ORF type:complete len:512 (-),score=110.84 TRINITY_DN61023_c0_g1_i1:168-1703(-)